MRNEIIRAKVYVTLQKRRCEKIVYDSSAICIVDLQMHWFDDYQCRTN